MLIVTQSKAENKKNYTPVEARLETMSPEKVQNVTHREQAQR